MRDPKDDKLRLGKGATYFVKSQLKRLPQQDETWEADFRALPKPITQSATHYLGMVLVPPHGDLLAMFEIEQELTVNDFATLLANAMRRPMALGSHRPRRIHVRGNPRCKELSPHLKEIGIEVIVQKKLPQVDDAYNEFVRDLKEARSADKIKPTPERIGIEKIFPAIAMWVKSYGHIEIGDQEGFGFVVRALDYGGIVFEDDRPSTLAEAMAALEKGLAEWFDREGIALHWWRTKEQTMAKKKQIKPSVGIAEKAKLIADQTVILADYAAHALVAAEQLRIKCKRVEEFSLQDIERAVLTVLPALSPKVRKKLAKPDGDFTVAEVISMVRAVAEAFILAGRDQKVALLLVATKLMECLRKNLVLPDEPVKQKKPKAASLLYQIKITLRESQPPIWRRIQVKDCTLDKLHEHIQTAMGWTNSHLHHFKIGEQFYGDPQLMGDNFEELDYADSTTTNLSDIIPENRRKLRFDYEYDFGDSWHHEILWEGCPKAEPDKRYPLCVDGERACPPEDCAGIWGYPDFIQAIENPAHERHEELLEWVGGSFDPEAFDPVAATKAMKKGLGDWRSEQW